MALSNNLLSKFAKSVNKKEQNPKESIMYGKITRYDEENDIWYAEIDGSERETPIESFAASIDLDQRVILMIKNHSLVVTGNIGSPATSQSYVDNKIYPTIQREVTVDKGGLKVQNYYSLEFDDEGKPIFKTVDNSITVEDEADRTKTVKIATVDMINDVDTESVDLADIRALWPDCNYE